MLTITKKGTQTQNRSPETNLNTGFTGFIYSNSIVAGGSATYHSKPGSHSQPHLESYSWSPQHTPIHFLNAGRRHRWCWWRGWSPYTRKLLAWFLIPTDLKSGTTVKVLPGLLGRPGFFEFLSERIASDSRTASRRSRVIAPRQRTPKSRSRSSWRYTI